MLSDLILYDGAIKPAAILWAIYFGIVIASITSYLIRTVFGKLICALIENGACSPESAVTVEEIGLKKNIFIKTGLKNHLNYKNMLVAITKDGKYYANLTYTDEPPQFKELHTITRISKSKIKESRKETKDAEDNSAQLTECAQAEEIAEIKPERVKFDTNSAKYYIPTAVHAKVKAIYNEKKIKLWKVILLIIGLGILTYLGTFALEKMLDMLSSLSSN